MTRSLWLARGQVAVPDEVVPAVLWDELADEADKCEPQAVPRHNPRPGLLVYRDGSITSPQRCRVHHGGPALGRLARLAGLAEVAGEATGRPRMTPIRYGYKFYTRGDFMHAHRDDGKRTITFSCGLTGDLGAMGWLPRLRWLTSDQVAAQLAHTPYPQGGQQLPIRHRALTGFDGGRIPHWRSPYEHDTGVLITICFTDLPDYLR
ncbi:MAG: hypothetical protein L0Y54_15110 [Sporichthyaceae bacterium]|nr:hypothetical protein [Sporichthyaceae bacterium]